MGGLSSGLPGLEALSGTSAAEAAATPVSAPVEPGAAAGGTTPSLSGFPVPNALSSLNLPSGNPFDGAMGGAAPPSVSTMLGLQQQLMKQFQAPAAAPSGSDILPLTAQSSLPPASPGNAPLSLHQLLSGSMARRLGNSGSGPFNSLTGNPFDPRNPFF
jgi:hypothetical protein